MPHAESEANKPLFRFKLVHPFPETINKGFLLLLQSIFKVDLLSSQLEEGKSVTENVAGHLNLVNENSRRDHWDTFTWRKVQSNGQFSGTDTVKCI